MLEKIISGGQTGVDRGALEAAIAAGVAYGGWVPKGRKAEDGQVPERFSALREAPVAGYLWRTERNVIDADATLVLVPGDPRRLTPGSRRTVEFAKRHGKPVRVFTLKPDRIGMTAAAYWVDEGGYRILNIAGTRESKHPGVQTLAAECVSILIDRLRDFDEEKSRPPVPLAAEAEDTTTYNKEQQSMEKAQPKAEAQTKGYKVGYETLCRTAKPIDIHNHPEEYPPELVDYVLRWERKAEESVKEWQPHYYVKSARIQFRYKGRDYYIYPFIDLGPLTDAFFESLSTGMENELVEMGAEEVFYAGMMD